MKKDTENHWLFSCSASQAAPPPFLTSLSSHPHMHSGCWLAHEIIWETGLILRGGESLGKEIRGRVADSEQPLKLEMGQLLRADRK